MYQKSTNKKIRSGNTILSLAQGEKKAKTILILIILYFLKIFDIKTIYSSYIYIEKFITKFTFIFVVKQKELVKKIQVLFKIM